MAEKEYKSDLRVINIGTTLFYDALVAQGVKATQIEWKPPVKQSAEVLDALNAISSPELKAKIDEANDKAVHRIIDSQPYLIDILPAGDVIEGLDDYTIIHSGPPIAYEDMVMLHQRGLVSACRFEHWAETDEDAVNAMVAKITEEVGHINILVNNAGIIKRIPMTEMSAAQFRQVIDVDLNAPFIVAKAIIPDMIAQGGGKIINICSMMSELGRETVSAYAAAKGGLKMLTKNIASEYGAYNIQCNGIGPGYIATPQTAPLREIQPDGSRHPFDQFIVAKTPAGRWGEAEDLGGPAVFLASEASDFVNGLILYVDGGILAYIGKQPQ